MHNSPVEDFLVKYIDEFCKLNIDVDSIILFGSQARGTAKISSDIDIAVVMNESLTARERGKLLCLGDEIDEHMVTNVFFTTRQALDKASDVFDTNTYIKEEGVVLWQS